MSVLLRFFIIVVIINKAFKLFKLVLVVYCDSCCHWWYPENSGNQKNVYNAKKPLQTPSTVSTWRFYKAWCQWQEDLTVNPFYFLYFHSFHYMGYFGRTLAFWGWGRLPGGPAGWAGRLQWFPAICSGAIPEASTPGTAEGLKNVRNNWERARDLALTVGNGPAEFQTSVINIKKVTVHCMLIVLGTLILKMWLRDFLHGYCGVLATF